MNVVEELRGIVGAAHVLTADEDLLTYGFDGTWYEHRPLACRVHFNLDIDPLLCELTPPESSPVPMFNTREHQFGALLLMGGPSNHNRLGDIREFFPRATHE